MTAFHGVIAFLIVQRLAELWLARRNTARLLAAGAVEHGARHYPMFVLLHASWLAALILAAPPDGSSVNPWLFAIFVLLQAGRIWVIASLGPYWTTRIIDVPGAPLVRRGPFRFVRHPNYAVVTGEIAVVPLMAGLVEVAVVFSILNIALLAWRVRVENRVLASRRRD